MTLSVGNAKEYKEKFVAPTSLEVLALSKAKYIIRLITTINSLTNTAGTTKSRIMGPEYVARKGKDQKCLQNSSQETLMVETA